MANIKKLKANGQDIVPITHEQAVLDSNGVTLDSKLNAINNAISRLENNSTSNVPSLEGNALTFGNYTIRYNETDDTLDFIYNGVIDEPVVPNSYVREGLSMYIDGTRNSISDITGNHTITNHGVTHTSDNKYLNFVASESDYIDTDLVPNLTQWSAEIYFYFTSTPTSTSVVFTWGVDSNQIRVAYSGSSKYFSIQSNSGTNYKVTDNANILTPHHLIITMNNGTITSYFDGVKSILTSNENVQTSPQALTLKIGCNYNNSSDFANINLGMFRFYDGKVLTDEEALQNYNYEIKNNYVSEGLALYIDAQDVTTQGSIRDITGKQTIVNHGVSTTLDNGCLNFVSSESDYIDGGFKPNLTKWSAEVYFYYLSQESAGTLLSWGASGNRTTISVWDSFMIAIRDDVQHTITSTVPTSLTHLVLTYNNGTIIAYVNGIKSQLTTSANVMSSQAGNLMIGTKYSASADFASMHLKSLRFYDGKVLTDEEASQNYNYETNRNDEVVSVTWIYNKKLDTNTGLEAAADKNACTEFIAYDNSYNYTLAIDGVEFFRVYYYDSSQSYIRNDSIANNFNGVITPPENTAYIRLKLNIGTVEFADLDNHVIFRKTHK